MKGGRRRRSVWPADCRDDNPGPSSDNWQLILARQGLCRVPVITRLIALIDTLRIKSWSRFYHIQSTLCYEMLVRETTWEHQVTWPCDGDGDGFPMPPLPAALTQSDGGLDSALIFPFSAYFSPLQLQAPVWAMSGRVDRDQAAGGRGHSLVVQL